MLGKEKGEKTEFLWQTRSHGISEEIDNTFTDLKNTPVKNNHVSYYYKEGSPVYIYSDILNTDVLLSELVHNSTNPPINILDIGTANGQFLRHNASRLGKRVKSFGLSAHNYPFRKSGIDYQIGDANRIIGLYPQNSFDLIVSKRCFIHLVDPLGALAQAYELLKPNGMMVIDGFYTPGISDFLLALIEYLKSSGYKVEADYAYSYEEGEIKVSAITTFIIRKTSPHLSMPVQYDQLVKIERKKSLSVSYLPVMELDSKLPSDFPPTLLYLVEKYGHIIFDPKYRLFHFEDMFYPSFDLDDVVLGWKDALQNTPPDIRKILANIHLDFHKIKSEWNIAHANLEKRLAQVYLK